MRNTSTVWSITVEQLKLKQIERLSGGIGIHDGFRNRCLRACRFNSCLGYWPCGGIGRRIGFKPRIIVGSSPTKVIVAVV